MSIRNLGSNNYRPSQPLVDPKQLLLQELANTPGVNFQQPNNPYADPPDGGGTTPQPSRSGTDINEILRSSPQGAEFLLGLGGSGGGRNNAFALAANRADRRVNRNRQRVQDLVKLDPTNPLAALVTFLGAREEHLLNEDLVGIRNAYGRQERLKERNTKFKNYLTQSGFGDAFKRLMAMSVEEGGFGGDYNLGVDTILKDKSILVNENNTEYPVSAEKRAKMTDAWMKVSTMVHDLGSGYYSPTEEKIIRETFSYLSAWFDHQNELVRGKVSDKEFGGVISKLDKVGEIHSNARNKKIKHEKALGSGKEKLTTAEFNEYNLELKQYLEWEKAGKQLSQHQINRKVYLQHVLKLNGGIAQDKTKGAKAEPKDEGLERIQASKTQAQRRAAWELLEPTEWLDWDANKQADYINKSIDYWKEKEKYSVQTGEEIPGWVKGLIGKYPFTGEMLNSYLDKGTDRQIIEYAKEALNFKTPGVTEAQVSDDGVTSVTRPTPEFYNTQDQEKFGDKKDESTNPYMQGVDTKGTTYIDSLDLSEYTRTNKYISPDALDNASVTDPNASTVLKDAMDTLDNVEKDVAKKANEIKDYGEKSFDVVTGKIKEGAGKITKGVESGVRKGREGWDFIKRETIKRKNELYKKLRDLNKEMESSRKLFGMTLPDPVKIDETGDGKFAGEGRPYSASEVEKSMEFPWVTHGESEYTRTVKYLAPDASPLTKKEQTKLEKLEEKFNEVLNEFKDFIHAPINNFGLPDLSFKFPRFSPNNMIEEAPKDSPKQYSAAEIEAMQNKEREERMGGMGGPDKSGSPGMSASDMFDAEVKADIDRGREEDNSNFIANLDEDTKFILQTENAPMDARAVGYRLKPKMKDGKKVTKNGRVVMEHRLRDGEKIPISYGLMQLTPKTAYATDYWKELVKKEKPANEEEKIELLFNPKHSVAMSKEFRKKLEDKIRGAVAKKNLAWTEEDIRMAVVTAYNWNGENFGSVIRRAGMDDFKSTLSKWDTIHKKNKESQVPDETWSQIRRYKTLRGWK